MVAAVKPCHEKLFYVYYVFLAILQAMHVLIIQKGECFAPLCPESIRAVMQVAQPCGLRIDLSHSKVKK